MSNKALWDRAFKTDPKHVKPITGKQYSGNSPKPYYIVERLTEEFGPCGLGWGMTIKSQTMERLTDTDVLHVAHITLWFMLDGKRGEIEQIGQTKATYVTNAGKTMVDEDAPKKSVTDALVKCASYLGFAGDIFSGRWDDSKYVAALREEFDPDKVHTRPGYNGKDICAEGMDQLDEEQQAYIRRLAVQITKGVQDGLVSAAVDVLHAQHFDNEQKLAMWSLLDSKVRSAIKTEESKRKEAK